MESLRKLNNLGTKSKVTLEWALGHEGVQGKLEANILARKPEALLLKVTL